MLRPLRKIDDESKRHNKTSEFSLDLHMHDKAAAGSPLRSYSALRALADDAIDRRRTEAVRASHLAAMNQAAGGKPIVSALAAKAEKEAKAKAKAEEKTKQEKQKQTKPNADTRVPSVPAGVVSTKPCFELRDKGACSKGASCSYSHDPAVLAQSAQSPRGSEKGKGKGKGKGKKKADNNSGGTSPKPTPPPSPRTDPCRHFAAGTCTRGDKCPWPHVVPGKIARVILAAAALSAAIPGVTGFALDEVCQTKFVSFVVPPSDVSCYEVSNCNFGLTGQYWHGIARRRLSSGKHADTTYQLLHDPELRTKHCEASRLAINRASDLAASLGPASAVRVLASVASDKLEWALDSGSGRPLLSKQDALDQNAKLRTPTERVILATANGDIPATNAAYVHIAPLKHTSSTQAIILENTPPVLSLGMLIQQDDYSMTWNKQAGFKFYDPDAGLIPTKVIEFVPSLISQHELDTSPQLKAQWERLAIEDKQATRALATPAIQPQAEPAPHPAIQQAVQPQEEQQADEVSFGPTPKHFLTHLPKHPRCEVCNASKLKRTRASRQQEGERTVDKATEFGDIVHCDHLVSLACPGTTGANHCLLVKDQATRVAGSFPVKNKGHQEAQDALLTFCDDVVRITLRSDNSRELIAAGLALRQYLTVTLTHSVPHRPQSNAIIERWGQEAITGVRCLLRQAGLPEKFWDLAIMYWTLCYNLQPQQELQGKCPLSARFPAFVQKHSLIPFGHLVHFREVVSQSDEISKLKWHGRGTEGICLGAYVHSDGTPDGSFYVCSIDHVIACLAGKSTTLKLTRTVDVRSQGHQEYPVANLRKQAQALQLIGIAALPPLLLQYADLELNPLEEPTVESDIVHLHGVGSSSSVAEEPSGSGSQAANLQKKAWTGTSKPDYISPAEWKSVGPTTIFLIGSKKIQVKHHSNIF